MFGSKVLAGVGKHPPSEAEVLLAPGTSAMTLLHSLLREAADAFPQAFTAAGLAPEAAAFRRGYPGQMPHFEAARVASPQRHEIARHICTGLQKQIMWGRADQHQPLAEALRQPVAPLTLENHSFSGQPGWQPVVVYRGQRWPAEHLGDLGAQLVQRGMISGQAGEALAWVCNQPLATGSLDLRGRRIAVLGGGAEMAPTRFWLEAGAEVLWLDTVPPPREWRQAEGMAGRLYWPQGNADLLTQPREILATLLEFAGDTGLDLGLYAYAPGQARELRLTAVMNALVDALPPELVRSVTLLVSPTTPTALAPGDLAAAEARRRARPAWEAALAGVGLLGRGGGSVRLETSAATRTVVAIQGASYQAAQYLCKVLMAECWTTGSQPLRVSANTAAITRTRSLSHPVFAAAFLGAGAFGVESMAPRQSRRLNGLLAIRDWLHPELPEPGAVRVHGGIHTLPYALEPALRVAAAFGFARSPRLLRGLLRG